MIDEFNQAIRAYDDKWQRLVSSRTNQDFFVSLKPTSVAWKTTDLDDFDKRFAELRDQCDQVHLGWVNERWLATLHLRDGVLENGLRVIKLMQRRPGSTDATGLDHLDFYFVPGSISGKKILEAEDTLKWTEEKNGEHCRWLSIWFDGTEAKLRTDTVLDVCAQEMKDCEVKILA